MKFVSIVGARPEFVQVAPLSKVLRAQHEEILVHTGQHYDDLLSRVFFEELGIPAPDYNLEVGSMSHTRQTAEAMVRLEDVLLAERPDMVIVRGDTNSTLAGALAAAKLDIPLVHVEAGERSYDNTMPEETNRLLTDRIASLHLCASKTAVQRLEAEGIRDAVYWVGDVMLDAMEQNLLHSRRRSTILTDLHLEKGQYSLVTIHRQGNTNSSDRMASIIEALNCIQERIIFPVHPRTRSVMLSYGLNVNEHVTIIPPVSYYDMLALEGNARLIATDSGGVQREAYFLGVPCLTLRDQTEWVETVSEGWNRVVGARTGSILSAWHSFRPASAHPPIFGDGHAAERIASILDTYTSHIYRHLDTRLFSQLPSNIFQH